MSRIPPDNLLAARETQADVGTALATPAEQFREDAAGVLRANFARLQEALRSLEEFGKLLNSVAGMRLPWLGWQLHCHPWGDSATVAPTAGTRRAPDDYY